MLYLLLSEPLLAVTFYLPKTVNPWKKSQVIYCCCNKYLPRNFLELQRAGECPDGNVEAAIEARRKNADILTKQETADYNQFLRYKGQLKTAKTEHKKLVERTVRNLGYIPGYEASATGRKHADVMKDLTEELEKYGNVNLFKIERYVEECRLVSICNFN